jgi:hypothetical protein
MTFIQEPFLVYLDFGQRQLSETTINAHVNACCRLHSVEIAVVAAVAKQGRVSEGMKCISISD